jgi:phosphoenolpyruvate synthase/pyruvate phosphate dikinase
MSNDTVFTFGGNAPHTNARQKDKSVTGGKGANLAEMASIGLPVPPGFTIATEECLTYLAGGSDFTAKLRNDVAAALMNASPGTATAGSSRCMAMSCSASITACSRKRSKSPRKTRAITPIPS